MTRFNECVNDWPPSCIGGTVGTLANVSQIKICEPILTNANRISFLGKLDSHFLACTSSVASNESAELVAEFLRMNNMRTIESIGEIVVEESFPLLKIEKWVTRS